MAGIDASLPLRSVEEVGLVAGVSQDVLGLEDPVTQILTNLAGPMDEALAASWEAAVGAEVVLAPEVSVEESELIIDGAKAAAIHKELVKRASNGVFIDAASEEIVKLGWDAKRFFAPGKVIEAKRKAREAQATEVASRLVMRMARAA